MTQHQANLGSQLCERALSIIEKIQRDFDEMKKAADEFEKRMAEQNSPVG